MFSSNFIKSRMRNHQPLNWSKWLVGFCVALLVWSLSPTMAIAQRLPNPDPQSIQPYLDRVIDKVTEFNLDNGMKFLVLERHDAPVVSFVTYADVGGVDEPDGKTGVAHFLEHLAFKGTTRIGTKDYEAEKKLLDQIDQLNQELKAAKAADNSEKVDQLQEQFQELQQKAKEISIQNEFGQIVEKAGGVGLNAATSTDYTMYSYSLPSNKLELWMSLESERFLDPVFREFFEEQDVILEERRWRTDNSPMGQLIEAFQGAAFKVHPYQRPVIGYDEDIRNLTREDVRDFFNTYYVPNNLTVAIVGDVDPENVKQLAEVYFGRYPEKPEPPNVKATEPPQTEPRKVTLALDSEPWYIEGFHRPALTDSDNAVYDMMVSILSDGRTSRIYKSIVQEKQVALSAGGFNGFPGDKYPNLVVFYGSTAPEHTVEEVAEALDAEIEKIKTEPVSQKELDRVKTKARASLLRSLDSNGWMAMLLAEYEVKTGDWRNLFKRLDRIAAVTPEDILRVAQETFTQDNKTTGFLLNSEQENNE